MQHSRDQMNSEFDSDPKTTDGEKGACCPLCERAVAQRELFLYFELEDSFDQINAIKVIKAFHPHWSEDDGVCPQCWKSYGQAGRVVRSLKRPSDPANLK